MVCFFICPFALVLLVLFWLNSEFTIRGKLIATGVYMATWGLMFVESLAVPVAQLVYALALYFIMYPSNWVSNR